MIGLALGVRDLPGKSEENAAALYRGDLCVGRNEVPGPSHGQASSQIGESADAFQRIEVTDQVGQAAIERGREFREAREAYAIGAAFIFLDLLERDV